MADNREVFPTLEDGSNLGTPLKARQEGDAAAAQNGSIGFAFKDNSGNVILPQLNADGTIGVSFDSGTPKNARGIDAAGSLTEAVVTGASIDSTANIINCIKVTGSCRRDSLFTIYYVDDADGTPVDTELGDFIVGSGQYSFELDLGKSEIDISGGTGTQRFEVRYLNFQKESTARAVLSLNEAS